MKVEINKDSRRMQTPSSWSRQIILCKATRQNLISPLGSGAITGIAWTGKLWLQMITLRNQQIIVADLLHAIRRKHHRKKKQAKASRFPHAMNRETMLTNKGIQRACMTFSAIIQLKQHAMYSTVTDDLLSLWNLKKLRSYLEWSTSLSQLHT